MDDIIICGDRAVEIIAFLESTFSLTVEKITPGTCSDYIAQIITRSPLGETPQVTLDQREFIESIPNIDLAKFEKSTGDLLPEHEPTRLGNRSNKKKCSTLYEYFRSLLGKIMYSQ